MIVQCGSCGVDTKKQPRDIRRNKTGNFYCSRVCSNTGYSKNYRTGFIIKCEHCDKDFTIQPRKSKAGTRFCSRTCAGKHRTKTKTKRRRCTHCRSVIILGLSRAKNDRVFCSMKCKNTSHAILMKGFGNSRYVDGRSTKPYHDGWNVSFKENIREMHGRKCILCKVKEETLKFKLDIHHIDFDKQNPLIENLAPLCKKCHLGKAHKGGMSCKNELSKQLEKLVARSLTHTT